MSVKFIFTAGGIVAASLFASTALSQESWTGLTDGAAIIVAPAAPSAAGGGATADPFQLAVPETGEAAAAVEAEEEKPVVDETALRYYAAQNDVARVSAEIRRIKLAHPDWETPEDLFRPGTVTRVDVEPVWALYREARYDAARQLIERLQAANPNWVPPKELIDKVESALANGYLVEASDAGDHARVLAIASNFPSLLTCDYVDVLWRVSAALAGMGNTERAFAGYSYVLDQCANPGERLATVQKAAELLPRTVVEQLIAKGRIGIDGIGEFETVRLDLIRRAVAQAIPEPELATLEESDLAALSANARINRSAPDAELIGWLNYARKEPEKGIPWFKLALSFGGGSKVIEGMILCTRDTGDLEGAMVLAEKHQASKPELRKLYVELVSTSLTDAIENPMPEERLIAFEAAVRAEKSALGAQSVGWFHYSLEDIETARQWFEASLSYEENAEAALGVVLSAQRLKDNASFKSLLETYAPKYPAVAAIKVEAGKTIASRDGRVQVAVPGSPGKPRKSAGAVKEAVALYEAGRYRDALAAMERVKKSGAESNDLKVLRGWTHYKLREFGAAEEAFSQADAVQSAPSTRMGLYYARQAMKPSVLQN